MKLRQYVIRFIVIGSLFGSYSASPAKDAGSPQKPTCRTTVHLYLDFSRSLRDSQSLAKAVEDLVTSPDGRTSPIALERDLYLVPFADRVGKEILIDSKNISAELESKFTTEPVDEEGKLLDRQRSNLVAVLDDFKEKVEKNGSNNTRTVFIVASDFEHDSSPSDTDGDDIMDSIDWDQRSASPLSDLRKVFSSPEGPILLLVREAHDSSTRHRKYSCGNKVVAGFSQLTKSVSQLYTVGSGAINLHDFLTFLKPLSITYQRINGDLHFNIKDKFCFRMPPVEIIAFRRSDNHPFSFRCSGADLTNGSCSGVISSADLQSHGKWKAGNDFQLFVKSVAPQDKNKSSDINTFDLNIDEYIFLSKFSGRLDTWKKILEGTAIIQSELWQDSKGSIHFLLNDKKEEIGEGDLDANLEPKTAFGPKISVANLSVKVTGGDLASLCYEEEDERNQLTLKVETDPKIFGIQPMPLPVEIVRYNEKDILEDLVHHASFPALFTLLTVFTMVLWRREATMAHLHEILGVAGGFWLILFFLIHRWPKAARGLDWYFEGKRALLVAEVICIVLAVIGFVILRRGVISPARSEAELDLDLLREEIGASRKSSRLILGVIQMIILVGLPLAVAGVLWVKTKDIPPACSFEVADSFSAREQETATAERGANQP